MADTPAFAARSSTHISFVHLDVPDSRAADPILIRTHHAGAELVEDAEGVLIKT